MFSAWALKVFLMLQERGALKGFDWRQTIETPGSPLKSAASSSSPPQQWLQRLWARRRLIKAGEAAMCCATFKRNRSPSGNQMSTLGTSDIRALKLSTRRVSRRGGHVLRAEPSRASTLEATGFKRCRDARKKKRRRGRRRRRPEMDGERSTAMVSTIMQLVCYLRPSFVFLFPNKSRRRFSTARKLPRPH